MCIRDRRCNDRKAICVDCDNDALNRYIPVFPLPFYDGMRIANFVFAPFDHVAGIQRKISFDSLDAQFRRVQLMQMIQQFIGLIHSDPSI